MEFRHLGRSGLLVSEISYGNWITHGSQVEEDAATACVRAALDLGITTFDTADVYAGTRAEAVLGRALAGQRRDGPGDLHQGLLADRARAATTAACPASTSWSRSTARCAGCRPTTSTCTRPTATTTPPRSRRRWRPSPTSYGPARRTTSASPSGRPTEIRAGHALARELRIPLVSNQPQYSMLWRVIEAEVVPTSRGARHRPDRVVADRPGRAHRQVPAGPAAAGAVAGHRREVRRRVHQPPHDRRGARARCSGSSRWPSRPA